LGHEYKLENGIRFGSKLLKFINFSDKQGIVENSIGPTSRPPLLMDSLITTAIYGMLAYHEGECEEKKYPDMQSHMAA